MGRALVVEGFQKHVGFYFLPLRTNALAEKSNIRCSVQDRKPPSRWAHTNLEMLEISNASGGQTAKIKLVLGLA